ncbi:LytTR family two component transcriptional regulator [Mucilaginibacter frigoritolerans]|uniref:LytTR family two component transcriptional regulator n=1 Tax=Mucilaginibacter frigoritolerans TaxID=652788 RepID=A0A562TLX0_9SPHI|nr:LytTR family DNA-binding domain-containing protein [Mucilaginibacter frigoritolerans]TWI94581.1 LytTR family two component transcriptional regulator [Mucilaginibacter frigoritolerans]
MELKCIIIDDEPHAISELKELTHCLSSLHVIKTFMDTSEAIDFLQNHGPVDFVFSDINMPGLNGIDAALVLRKYCHFLIFVSAHSEFALDAYGVSASAYLLKPVSQGNFVQKVDELIAKLPSVGQAQQKEDDVLFIKGNSKNNFIKVNYNDIIYIEGLLNYVIIYTERDKLITYMGLTEILQKLGRTDLFFRINKSMIISTNHIRQVNGNMVYLSNNAPLGIGRSYRSAFQEYILKRTLNNL